MYRQTSISCILALMGLVGTLFLSIPVAAQLQRGQCRCEDIPTNQSGYLVNEKKAIELVNKLLADVRKYSTIKFNETILVKETDCPIPSALLCRVGLTGRGVREERYITYNNDYLNRITKEKGVLTWVDWHVLAHEIGHHVLGHLDKSNPYIPLGEVYEKVMQGDKKLSAKYVMDSPQAHEFEADFFALWLLAHTNERFPFKTFITSFDTTYIHSSGADGKVLTTPARKTGRNATPSVASASHPFFGDRLWAMTKFWDKLQTERTTLAKANYFSNAASAAYIELHPERPFWDMSFVAGSTVAGKPMFTVDGQPVDALLYSVSKANNIYAGLNISRFQWHSPWRYEAEVAYSTQRYATLIGSGSSQQLLETLDLRYLTAFPRVTWSPLSRKRDQFISSRFGFFVSGGPIFRIPLGLDYQNVATTVPSANLPALQLSVNPRVSVGVELLKKTLRPRGYKLAFGYEYQGVKLKSSPHSKNISHNLDVTVYYNFARW